MTKLEKEELLNSFKWIKVHHFRKEDHLPEDQYDALEEHHIEETLFLINKVRELVLLVPTT
jgi:hypothetical protein